MTRNLSFALAAAVLLLALLPRSTYASASSLTHKDVCLADGKVQSTFAWTGTDPTSLLLWVDLSTQDNGWQPGTFISAGPFVGNAMAYSWNELLPSTPHLVRINQQLSNGTWDPSPGFGFTTASCTAGGSSGGSTGGPTLGGTTAAKGQDCFYRGPLPDALCTPGVIDKTVTRDNIQSTICVAGYADTVRPSTSVTAPLMQSQMVLYGIGSQPAGNYVEDALIPIELGGAPSDPRNLYPQPLTGSQNAHDKDAVEKILQRAVCDGRVPLQGAQRAIAGDWTYALTLLGITPTPADLAAAQAGGSTAPSSTTGSSTPSTTQTITQSPAPTPTPAANQTLLPPPPPPPARPS